MGQIVFQATLGGQVAVAGPNTASSFTLTLPAATDTLVGKATTDTLTNKSISGSTNTLTNIANASLTNSNVTIGSTAISLGGTSTTLAGLTGVTSSAITDTGLTSGRVTYAGASGLLSDSATFVFNGTSFGVGTTNPVATQQIKGSGTSGQVTASWILENSSSGTGGMDITGSPGASRWRFLYGGGPSTGTNALTEAMCIGTEGTNAGRVGIGTSSPTALLTLGGVAATGYESFLSTGTTTAYNFATMSNTGANLRIGIESASAVGLLTGSSNYSGVIGTLTATSLHLGTNSTVRATIDSSGNLGLGVTPNSSWLATSKALQVANGVALEGRTNYFPYLVLSSNVYLDTAGDYRYLGTASAARYLQDSGSHAWFRAASGTAGNVASFTQAMTLDSSGNLLVGTTDTTKTNTGFRVESGVPNTSRASTGSFFEFYDTGSGSRIGYISNSGGVATLYNTTSDQRLKTNIVDAPSGNIDDIKVRSFDWLANNSHQKYGMVAQELIEVAPYAVNKPENPDEMMAVDYSKLVPMMIKEIQDLKQRIAILENK